MDTSRMRSLTFSMAITLTTHATICFRTFDNFPPPAPSHTSPAPTALLPPPLILLHSEQRIEPSGYVVLLFSFSFGPMSFFLPYTSPIRK